MSGARGRLRSEMKPSRAFFIVAGFISLNFAAPGVGLAAGNPPPLHLAGYEAVPIRYGGLNKMIMQATVNGHRATLIVDTGATLSVFDAARARQFGIVPAGAGSKVQVAVLNGRPYPVGIINDLKAGAMDLGGGPIALFTAGGLAESSPLGNLDADGIIGTDILRRHKAVINCRTRYIFFPTTNAPRKIAQIAAAEHFTRIPLREEATHEFSVPTSINGRAGRLLVDTGAFVTTFDQRALNNSGIGLQATQFGGQFSDGVTRQVSIGQFNRFSIGAFNVRPQKLAVAVLPELRCSTGKCTSTGFSGWNCSPIILPSSTSAA